MPKVNDHIAHSIKKSYKHSSPDCDVAIIGAGPYGLSAGAHLKAKGLTVRVFGEPMEFWADKMPAGMLLRSPREASNLSDPHAAFTLDAYDVTGKIDVQSFTGVITGTRVTTKTTIPDLL